MESKSIKFMVESDAGYGVSLRGQYGTESDAKAKAARLKKKGHTKVSIMNVEIISKVEFEE